MTEPLEQLAKLKKLRDPFPSNQISKLPKPTKQQTDEVRADYKKGIRCEICGMWHHPKVIHLDYVGHAALTDRLLDVDPFWTWDFLATDERGLPLFSSDGLWITLTIRGVTRKGFGDAQGKDGPNAIKEMIGDALRNAAMRFGAALELWHKGDLHVEEEEKEETPFPEITSNPERNYTEIVALLADMKSDDDKRGWLRLHGDKIKEALDEEHRAFLVKDTENLYPKVKP